MNLKEQLIDVNSPFPSLFESDDVVINLEHVLFIHHIESGILEFTMIEGKVLTVKISDNSNIQHQ